MSTQDGDKCMNLLALDQSSNITGWAVFKDDSLIATGTIQTTQGIALGNKLVELVRQTNNIIKQYNINEVILENIQMQNNTNTYRVLAEVLGALEIFLSSLNITYSIIGASSWKSILGIKGTNRAQQKANAYAYVVQRFGVELHSQDEADAVCIGAAHLNMVCGAF